MWGGVNRSIFGYPPLVHAAAANYPGVCRVLLNRGADVKGSTQAGLITAKDVCDKSCYDLKEVSKVIKPYVDEAKRLDDKANKERREERAKLDAERLHAEEASKEKMMLEKRRTFGRKGFGETDLALKTSAF